MTRKSATRDFGLLESLRAKRAPTSFDLEITARCNNDCRHCYNNLPAGDPVAAAAELTAGEIIDIASQAAELGVVWCLLTGGEPLLRRDFSEIYLGLKRLGLLVSVFTNACLITPEHVDLFGRYPPRDIEVSVYGVTPETCESVTRRPRAYETFMRGLDRLATGGIPVRLKAAALRSNIHEIDKISAFCRQHTKDYYRFDPLLRLRFDGDTARNAEIRAERLTPDEIVTLEKADSERWGALQAAYAEGRLVNRDYEHTGGDLLFHCEAGRDSFTVGCDGTFRLCTPLLHPDTTYDLRAGALREAWKDWVPYVRGLRGTKPEFITKCRRCALAGLCLWCPGHAALETGEMDSWVEYFCEVAHARAAALAG